MRALIRNPGETVTENDGIVGIDWDTGAPLTNPDWCGGSYTLVDDYIPPCYDDSDDNVTKSSKYVEIAELKARLAALENEL